MVETRLESHDANQLELKLEYTVAKKRRRQRYRVETYMFVPRTLGVNGQTFPSERFFEHTVNLVRLRTPRVALRALAKHEQAARWHRPLEMGLDALLSGARGDDHHSQTIRQLKLVGAVHRAAVRDEGRELLERLEGIAAGVGTPLEEADVAKRLRVYGKHASQALDRLRKVGGRCDVPAVPTLVRDTWHAVDEYVAMHTEEVTTSLVIACDARGGDTEGHALYTARQQLADLAIAQYEYRRGRGYPSFIVPGTDNVDLPRRRRLLKRVVSSVLYLDSEHRTGGNLPRELAAGAAAALAMLFAILVTIWAQLEWGLLSSTFVAVMVGSYIVKDRIKEWGKRALGRRLARYMPDFTVELRDPQSGRTIGTMRETADIVDTSRIDVAIRRARHVDHPSAIAQHARAERVIRFVKDVAISSRGLERVLSGVDGLTDIMRINFNHFRTRMDKAIETHHVVNPETRRIEVIPCSRVYHINMVLRVTRGRRGPTTLRRVRVVVDQHGLRGVEHVSLGGADPARGTVGVGVGIASNREPEDHETLRVVGPSFADHAVAARSV